MDLVSAFDSGMPAVCELGVKLLVINSSKHNARDHKFWWTHAQPETPGKRHVYVAFNRRMHQSNTRTTTSLNHSKQRLNNIPRIILLVFHSSHTYINDYYHHVNLSALTIENRIYLGRVSLGRVQLERVLLARWNRTASIWNASSWHVIQYAKWCLTIAHPSSTTV